VIRILWEAGIFDGGVRVSGRIRELGISTHGFGGSRRRSKAYKRRYDMLAYRTKKAVDQRM
jgi:hypothetical protein